LATNKFITRQIMKDNLVFSYSGQQDGKTQEQLINFTELLNAWFPEQKILLAPKTWQEAFVLMKAGIDSISLKKKKVIFFDELPWLDNYKSGFLSSDS
jgi:uncharacterized protein